MLLPPFRLYGLIGCPHCISAEEFLRGRQCPVITIVANDDPIALAGVKALTNEPNYPVLCYTPEKEIIKGFNEGEYERLVKDYRAKLSAGTFDLPLGEQQPQPQGPIIVQASEAPQGAS